MNLTNLFGKENQKEKIKLLSLSAIAGISGGGLVIVINDSTRDLQWDVSDIYFLGVYLVCSIIYVSSKWFALNRNTRLIHFTMQQVRQRIGNALRQSELSELERYQISDLYMTMTKDARSISRAARYHINLLQTYTLVGFCFLYVVHLSSSVAIAVFITFLMGLGVYSGSRYLIAGEQKSMSDTESRFFHVMGQLLDGFKELKLSEKKSNFFFSNELMPLAKQLKNQGINSSRLFGKTELFLDGAFFMFLATEIFIFSIFLPLQTVTEIMTAIVMCWGPVRMFNTSLPFITTGDAALDRLYKLDEMLRNQKPELSDYVSIRPKINPEIHSLRLENVQFQYPEEEGFVIGPVNMTLRSGHITFLVGGNGSGKSTLVKIITGLYEPSAGQIFLNESIVSLRDYRYLSSCIFSDYHLFEGLYGIENIQAEQIYSLLDEMALNNKTDWGNGKFSNIKLSAGQRKRLAMIGALLEDMPIVIFDEWAAEQDHKFRLYFYETLLPRLKQQNKVILVISHDDRFFHLADTILTMEQGQISNGTPSFTSGT
ncbi:MAG: cyclic peptide export ABC transporter [SAR324 cluster bacterium]|nr:cyclic peptide export ABC transporter [SAR324 cluster bacterium]